jgi:mannonate dehydratase
MQLGWRWFGPTDTVDVSQMTQAGVETVVSGLYDLPSGVVWTPERIAGHQRKVATLPNGLPSGLAWTVVESLPVSDDIKRGGPAARAHVAAWKDSLRNLAEAGISVVCYNFMPVLDWTRTDLAWPTVTGATCLRFDLTDFAVFDIHVLRRPGAADVLPETTLAAIEARRKALGDEGLEQLGVTIAAGLPGAAQQRTVADVRRLVAEYAQIGSAELKRNLVEFLGEVVPVAEQLGLRLCCHPDDPPFPLMGLPRVVSTLDDCRDMLTAVDCPASGITFCAGSFGARADNDLLSMFREMAPRIHFLHFRSVHRERNDAGPACSFYEDEHLEGSGDLVALVAAALAEEAARRAEGRVDSNIPMRPDHGQRLLGDHDRDSPPGYPLYGRMRALAELRGVVRALSDPRASAHAAAIATRVRP